MREGPGPGLDKPLTLKTTRGEAQCGEVEVEWSTKMSAGLTEPETLHVTGQHTAIKGGGGGQRLSTSRSRSHALTRMFAGRLRVPGELSSPHSSRDRQRML